jgi:predicted DNA-binding transcriptional regulator AlpA
MGVLAGYIREKQLAQELGLTVWALRAWRKRGYGPQAAKIGRMVVYRADEVADFIEDQSEGRK